MKNHVGEAPDEGYLAEVAALTEAAFAAAVAYKKDLLELARGTSSALDGLDHAAAGDASPFPTVPIVDVSQTGVFLETSFFPKSASGHDDVEQEIEDLPNG